MYLICLNEGGAISQAKGALSSWWSNLLVSPDPVQKGVDCLIDNKNDTSAITEDLNDTITVIDSDIEIKNNMVNEAYKIGEVNTV